MSTDLRSILDRVASGEITPEEGQDLLDRAPGGPAAAHEPPITAVAVHGAGVRLTVVADPTVDTAVAEGSHRVERVGDRLLIHSETAEGGYETQTPRSTFMTWINTGLRGGRSLRVRVNPGLPLDVSIIAGSLLLAGAQAPVHVVVEAASAKLEGGRGPVQLAASTGSAEVSWQFIGDSSVSVELGSASVRVLPGSDAVVTTESSMATVSLRSPDGTTSGSPTGAALRPVTAGSGNGRLAISARLGSADVTVS